eukprot:s400_g3.t1
MKAYRVEPIPGVRPSHPVAANGPVGTEHRRSFPEKQHCPTAIPPPALCKPPSGSEWGGWAVGGAPGRGPMQQPWDSLLGAGQEPEERFCDARTKRFPEMKYQDTSHHIRWHLDAKEHIDPINAKRIHRNVPTLDTASSPAGQRLAFQRASGRPSRMPVEGAALDWYDKVRVRELEATSSCFGFLGLPDWSLAATFRGPGEAPAATQAGPLATAGSIMPRPVKPDAPAACDRALVEVRRQQEASQASIELLKDWLLNKQEQHQQWQRAVEDLLAQVQVAAESEDVRPITMPQHILYKREASEEVPSMSSQMQHSAAVQRQHSHGMASTATPLNTMSRSPGFHVQENSPLKKLVNEMLEEANRTEDAAEPKGLWASLRERSRRIVEAQWFEYVTGAVIMLNMITTLDLSYEAGLEVRRICVEVDASIQTGESPWPPWVELSFWFLYTVELIFRLLAHGRLLGWLEVFVPGTVCVCGHSRFILDAFLVAVGFIALVVIPIAGDDASIGGFEFEKLLVVRGLRLLRLVRALRMVRQFKVMWRLVYSLLGAGQTMMSMFALILLALFIFGCVAVELIRKDEELLDDPETGPVVRKYFNTLPTILTLLQFVTLDSVAAIYYPLVMFRPSLIIFFTPIFLFISVGLMNLVTAILVESALESAQQEAEAGRQELKNKIRGALPSLLDIFQTLDTDMSGRRAATWV